MEKSLNNRPKNNNTSLADKPFLSISDFSDIRYIFGSKEWVCSYYATFRPQEIFLIKTETTEKSKNLVIGLQKAEENGKTLVPLGTPYNDYNYLLPKTRNTNRFNLEIAAFRILEQIKNLQKLHYETHIDLLFDSEEISILKSISSKIKGLEIIVSSTPSIRCIYKNILENPEIVEQGFSPKLLRRIKKEMSKNNFTLKIINGQSLEYPKAFQNLLLHRKINFLSQNKEDYASAFTNRFEQFIKTLTNYPSVKLRTSIFELTSNKEYIASDLFFHYQNIFLCYLRGFNRSHFKISPGMILSYLIHKHLTGYRNFVIIDYTRGDEHYKLRIGGKKTTLCELIFN